MVKVGITGGIGSGKSTVCKLFSILGIPTYSSDIRAQQLMMFNHNVVNALKATFGPDIYNLNGSLNKDYLSKLVFDSPETRQIINSIVHPAVQNDFTQWCEHQKAEIPYVIQESAILFETELWKDLDILITVTCPIDERIERIVKRDNISIIDARKKINSQMTDEVKIEKSTFVIESNANSLLIKNVLDIHKKITQNEN